MSKPNPHDLSINKTITYEVDDEEIRDLLRQWVEQDVLDGLKANGVCVEVKPQDGGLLWSLVPRPNGAQEIAQASPPSEEERS